MGYIHTGEVDISTKQVDTRHMEFPTYYRSLTPDEKARFAKKAKTTRNYIEIHLLTPDRERRKTPRNGLMDRLAKASGGKVSKVELLAYFFDVAA